MTNGDGWATLLTNTEIAMGSPMKDFGEGLDGAANGLSKLEKLGLLPLFGWRKKNMLAAQNLELEMDAQKRRHERTQELEAAKVKITTMIALEQANKGIAECAQMVHDPNMTEEDIREHYALTARAAAAVCTEAIEAQYARERIGLYAAKAIAENPQEVNDENPSKTWLTKFQKYAGDIRDEEVMELWGKILAGEVCKPGSFSLKTLDILSTLDERDAKIFQKLAPYVINNSFIPYGAYKDAHITAVQNAVLENLGLITKQMICRINGAPIVRQRDYIIIPSLDLTNFIGFFDIQCFYLTPAGIELYNIANFSKESSEHGADFFINYMKKQNKISLIKQTIENK